MERRNQFGVYFILKSMELGPSFRSAEYATRRDGFRQSRLAGGLQATGVRALSCWRGTRSRRWTFRSLLKSNVSGSALRVLAYRRQGREAGFGASGAPGWSWLVDLHGARSQTHADTAISFIRRDFRRFARSARGATFRPRRG